MVVPSAGFTVVSCPSFPSPIKLFSWVSAPDLGGYLVLGLVTLPFGLVYPPPDEIGEACAKHIFLNLVRCSLSLPRSPSCK